MSEPKVSVIVPMFNVKPYIRQALDSLALQTLQDIEIIIIDDGSTDGCQDTALEFCQRDPRFRYVRQSNGGYGKAVNHGLDLVTGEYVGILEPDDFAAPYMYEVLHDRAIRHGAEVVRGDYFRYWDPDRGQTTGRRVLERNVRPFLNGRGEGFVYFYQAPELSFSASSIWSGIYRREFLEKNGIRLIETPGASFQDLPFFWDVLFASQRVYCVDQPLTNYRQSNPNASSFKGSNKGLLLFSLFETMHQHAEARDLIGYRRVRNLLYSNLFKQHYWNLETLAVEYREQFLEELARTLRVARAEDPTFGLPYCTEGEKLLAERLIDQGAKGYHHQAPNGVPRWKRRIRKYVWDTLTLPFRMVYARLVFR